ncbi:MAG TPA: hypothetical protein VM012_13840, partial [Flavitalea sp.]|nr:hypothetical protein [Flavitalea sp.]
EFSFNGELYDVVKIEKRQHKTLLYCLNDKNEDQLIRNFAKAIKSTQSGKNNKRYSNLPTIETYYCSELQQALYANAVIHSYFTYDAALFSNSEEINIPPPRS